MAYSRRARLDTHRRSLVGMALAAILLASWPGHAVDCLEKVALPVPPAPVPLSLRGAERLPSTVLRLSPGALPRHSGSLTRAAFLSARNERLGQYRIIAAGLVTAVTVSPWPDLLVGLGIS